LAFQSDPEAKTIFTAKAQSLRPKTKPRMSKSCVKNTLVWFPHMKVIIYGKYVFKKLSIKDSALVF
jgi:hypothetical protein